MANGSRRHLMRNAKAGVEALAQVETILASSGVATLLRHLVKLRVSQINGCAYWKHYEIVRTLVNGTPGIVFRHNEEVVAAISFAMNSRGRCDGIFVVRNPDKLARISAT